MKPRHHPIDIGVRIILALGGGYLLTLLSARQASAVLPMQGSESSMAASLAAWLVFVGVVIWAFTARTALGASLPLVVTMALLMALAQ